MAATSRDHTHPGTVELPTVTRYATISTGANNRKLDSERILYENLALKLKPSTKGITRVVSENTICVSCVGVQFKLDFPNVFLLTRSGVKAKAR